MTNLLFSFFLSFLYIYIDSTILNVGPMQHPIVGGKYFTDISSSFKAQNSKFSVLLQH